MSLKLHKLRVSKIVKETKDAVSVYFDVPDDLKDIFKYIHGQFISIQVNIRGTNYRREYSLCTSPYCEDDFAITAKKIGNGVVSSYLYHNLREGDVLEVFPPNGKFFTELDPANELDYVLIAGGSGITPLLSIAKSVLHVEPESNVIFYYGNATEESIIFKDELTRLMNRYGKRLKVYFTLSEPSPGWKGLTGLINRDALDHILNETVKDRYKEAEYFICGPLEMMETVKSILKGKIIPDEKIHIEYFTPPVVKKETDAFAGLEEIGEDGEPREREVEVILDGNEYKLNVDPETSILDAAIAADIDPPFSCKSGICTTCRAKLLKGKVHMDEREGLSDSEIEDGYILTCQSHPLTDDVKVEYM
jgi:ring-1,2-phenylacetyl-CoA epoxidase subunit PaaE